MIRSYLRSRADQQEGNQTEFCNRCGLNHAVLNVEIIGRTLIRKVRGPAHRLKAYGGAFGFSARFWDAHIAEIDELIVIDEATGEVFRGKVESLGELHRQVFSPAFGLQVVIPIHVLERFQDAGEFLFWAQ